MADNSNAWLYANINNNISRRLNERLAQVVGSVGRKRNAVMELYANKFEELAHRALSDNYAGEYAENVYVKYSSRGGWVVYVKNAKPNLSDEDASWGSYLGEPNIMAFLEYGTGLRGKENPHPTAQLQGWEYAINESEYRNFAGRRGWFYRDRGGFSYREDITIKTSSRGKVTKFSSGIVPIGYIYYTRRKLRGIINDCTMRTEGKRPFLDLDLLQKRLQEV